MDHSKKLPEQNKIFANILHQNQISSVNFIIIGNSIASGYSVASKIQLFFDRNQSLFKELKKQKITYSTYHFSQPYNNSNQTIFNWIKDNQTQKEVLNQQIKHYFFSSRKEIDQNNINIQTLKKYFSKNIKDIRGIQDLIKYQKQNHLNIIIFIGNTGATMDYVENNKIFNSCKAIILGAKKDFYDCQKITKYISKLNPKNLIVVMDLPFHETFPFIFLNWIIFIFNRLVRITNRYQNIIFSKGGTVVIKQYHVGNQRVFDVHPDKNHYLNMINFCMASINSKIYQLK